MALQDVPQRDSGHQKRMRYCGRQFSISRERIGRKLRSVLKDRTDVQCLHRWQKVLSPELVKGPWSKEEDEIIIELVNKYGPKK